MRQVLRAEEAGMQSKAWLAAASIIVIWLAVLFVGVFGGDISNHAASGDTTEVPVVVAVAFVAMIATVFTAWFGFRE
jgi:hypothetical protein